MLFIANAWIGGTVNAVFPLLYGLTTGVYFLPGALAQRLFERGGVALVTATLAGLISSPFQPIGFWAALIALSIGGLQELAFLVSRYRHWNLWQYYAGAAFAGTVFALAMVRVVAQDALDAGATVLLMGGYFIAPIAFTALALWIASRARAAGVGANLRGTQQVPLRD